MSDLIEQADTFLSHMIDQRENVCDYCQRDKIEDLMPRLVAEIKRLRAKCEDKSITIRQMASNLIDLQEQLVTWQKIAIDERAGHICDNYTHCDFDDKHREQAAQELQLEATKEAGYVERLEKENAKLRTRAQKAEARIADLVKTLQVEKSAHDETKYADSEAANQEFSRIAKQHSALRKLGQAKRERGKALRAHIDEQATQIAKDAELARWQKIAIEERCKAIMLIEKLKSVANDPSWENNGMKFNLGHYMEQAAQELRLEASKEAGYVERLEKENAKLIRDVGYLQDCFDLKVRSDWQQLTLYVKRLEAAYLKDSMQSDELAQAALDKIREGK